MHAQGAMFWTPIAVFDVISFFLCEWHFGFLGFVFYLLYNEKSGLQVDFVNMLG